MQRLCSALCRANGSEGPARGRALRAAPSWTPGLWRRTRCRGWGCARGRRGGRVLSAAAGFTCVTRVSAAGRGWVSVRAGLPEGAFVGLAAAYLSAQTRQDCSSPTIRITFTRTFAGFLPHIHPRASFSADAVCVCWPRAAHSPGGLAPPKSPAWSCWRAAGSSSVRCPIGLVRHQGRWPLKQEAMTR